MYLIAVIDLKIIKKGHHWDFTLFVCDFSLLCSLPPLSVYFCLVFSLQMLTVFFCYLTLTQVKFSVRQEQAMAKISYLVQDLKINFIFSRSIFVSYQTYLLLEFQALKS